ncbi:MAG: hypothetical protein LBH04_04315 [Tannerellaceae bacterium]|nr:hypothetical protein [Tannerellaceae bacterium]
MRTGKVKSDIVNVCLSIHNAGIRITHVAPNIADAALNMHNAGDNILDA